MLPTVAIVAGYMVLIATAGWAGVFVAGIHIGVMLLATRK
jgi:hypothetical protein